VTTTPDSLDRLQAALDALADALEHGRPDDVLAVEVALGEAVRDLQAGQPFDAAARSDDLRRRLLNIRLTMQRCEALGSAVRELSEAMQPPVEYGRRGRSTTRTVASSGARAAVQV
jgi:hypothetical protein